MKLHQNTEFYIDMVQFTADEMGIKAIYLFDSLKPCDGRRYFFVQKRYEPQKPLRIGYKFSSLILRSLLRIWRSPQHNEFCVCFIFIFKNNIKKVDKNEYYMIVFD